MSANLHEKQVCGFLSASVDRKMDAVFEITKKIIKATYDEKEANIKTLQQKIDKLMKRVNDFN